jgi:hypothetical protein
MSALNHPETDLSPLLAEIDSGAVKMKGTAGFAVFLARNTVLLKLGF